jgi:hypothetical protein
MRVLFIDDECYRFNRMLDTNNLHVDATHVDDGIKAIWAILNGPWDYIYFDHDLATFLDDLDGDCFEITGYTVAKVLVEQSWKPTNVVIHSTNSIGANNIKNLLDDYDIPNKVYPFYKFMEGAFRKSNRSS